MSSLQDYSIQHSSFKSVLYYPQRTGEDLRGFPHEMQDIQFNHSISLQKPRRSENLPIVIGWIRHIKYHAA